MSSIPMPAACLSSVQEVACSCSQGQRALPGCGEQVVDESTKRERELLMPIVPSVSTGVMSSWLRSTPVGSPQAPLPMSNWCSGSRGPLRSERSGANEFGPRGVANERQHVALFCKALEPALCGRSKTKLQAK